MKSGTWQDEARENECIHHPWQAPVRTSDPVFTFWTQCLAVSPTASGPARTLSRYRVRSDRQGQEIKTPWAPRTGSAREGESTNRIAVVHNMQGVLKCLTSCQENVPGLVRRTNLARQGSDSLAAADRTRQVQPDMLPRSHIHCRPLFLSLSSHLRLSSRVVPFVCCRVISFFIYLLYLLSIYHC